MRYLIRAIVFLLLYTTGLLQAQTLEPRLYANVPVGMNFLIVGAGYSQGALESSPELELEDPNLNVRTGVLAYARSFDFFGKIAKIDIIAPSMDISGTAKQNGVELTRDVNGIGDIKTRFSLNLFGSPALGLKDFMDYKQDVIVGVSVQVTAPTGQYDETKLINVGTNTWALKPGIGISKRFGKAIVEFTADAEFYSINNEFVSGKLSRDPVYSAQTHVIYNFQKGMWAALGVNYYWGGEAVINEIPKDNALANSRVSGLFMLPIDKYNAIKLVGSTGVSTRTGTDFNSVLLVWQYRWGAGL